MTDFCRCKAPAIAVCIVCKSPLCAFHTKKEVRVLPKSRTSVQETMCFPSCTSSFGELEAPVPKPRPSA